MKRFNVLFLIICFAISNLYAEDMTRDHAVSCLLGDDTEKADEAVEFLAAECNDSTFHLIDAAVGGRLCSFNGMAVERKGDGSFYKLYPAYEPAAGVDGSAVKEIKLSRKQRMKFNDLMPIINLGSDMAEVRAEAFSQLASKKDPKTLAYMQAALKNEKDSTVLAAANSAVNSLLLFEGTDEEQAAAIAFFGENGGPEAHQLLNEYSAKQGVSEDNMAATKKILAQWNAVERNNHIYQNVFSGLSLGSILILVALGLSIIYGLAGIINMSHGEFMMIGAYTTYCMQQLFAAFLPEALFDWAFFLSLPLSFIVTAAFGLVIERLVIRHLYNRPLESLLATWGISLILIQLARTIFGDLTTVKAPAILSGGLTLSSGLILPYNRLFIIVLTIIIFTAVFLLFKKTRLGIKIRAVTQNRNMSACVGISTKKIEMITFMLGSGLAGITGCAITLIGNVVPDMGQTYIVDSFLVVVTGGVGKLAGCVASGLGIGIMSKAFEAAFEAVYGKVLILFLIIVFLQYRPKGLFPDKGRIGDD